MTSNDFVARVIKELGAILADHSELSRMNLAQDIVAGWRNFLDTYTAEKMSELVLKVATDNRVPLDDYERGDNPRTAAEMILYAVDGFYRKSVTHFN